MTRTPQLTAQHKHPQDQQYRQKPHFPQPRPPHQPSNPNDRYHPPPLPQSEQYRQQLLEKEKQSQQHVPPLHAYSTNDLLDVTRNQTNEINNTNILITTSDELLKDTNNIILEKKPCIPKDDGTATDDINLNPLNLPVYERSESSFRWIVLILACWGMFGSYYCYDNPSALSTQLQSGKYNLSSLQFNLLYTVYSTPNMILPLFGGVLVDKIGAEIRYVNIYYVNLM